MFGSASRGPLSKADHKRKLTQCEILHVQVDVNSGRRFFYNKACHVEFSISVSCHQNLNGCRIVNVFSIDS